MPVTADQPAPYAPASAILGLIERHRNKGLPSPVDSDVLARAGISDSLIPRTLQALQALDLITDEGQPSQVLEGIRLAPEAEYKQRLVEWLNGAYADALTFIDPATDDDVRIRDAFRSYKPVGQQSRMVTLFTGLFKAAGVAPERQRQSARVSANPTQQKLRIPTKTPKNPPTPEEHTRRHVNHHTGLPPALAGLLASLPKDGEGWTKERRDLFVSTFGSVLDFCFPVGISSPSIETTHGL